MALCAAVSWSMVLNKTFPITRALISVSDKTNLIPFATRLVELGIKLVATGGTYQVLKQHMPVEEVSNVTQFPEMLEGRLKTLHPIILGGILAKKIPHQATIAEHGLCAFDLVVCNLYPFNETIQKPGCTWEEAIENIDVGGPTMLRAAAKNHQEVAVVCSPTDYDTVLEAIAAGGIAAELSQDLARKAFFHTAAYDAAIAEYFSKQSPVHALPEQIAFTLQKTNVLRYGENPHQPAAVYTSNKGFKGPLFTAIQLSGKTLSYNNYVDAECAYHIARSFSAPTCAIVKHDNPCGVASAATLEEAYALAFAGDPESAFGGIIAFNRPVTGPLLETLFSQQFLELVLAPCFEKEAKALAALKPNVRLLAVDFEQPLPALQYRALTGGWLVQAVPTTTLGALEWVTTTVREDLKHSLEFAWCISGFVKSNAIVLVNDTHTIGIGVGQTSRVFSLRTAILRAQDAGFSTHGAVMASDAFFPFADSMLIAKEAGIAAIIQPGGSMRDKEVIAEANKLGIAMIFTHERQFRH